MNLPPLYSLEEYWSCRESGNDFCTFAGRLASSSPGNPIWKEILVNNTDNLIYDRSLLHRGICIPKEYSGNLELQKQYSETYLSKEIDHLNLTANIDQFVCVRDPVWRTYDYVILGAFLLYIIFTTLVSIIDKFVVKDKKNGHPIWHFSLFHSWGKTINGKKGRDYENLKCMQGLRFFLMVATIWCHTMLSYLFVYLDDPMFVEKIIKTPQYVVLLSFIAYDVQPFFLMSSWLCTLQIYNIYEDNGQFTFKDLIITIVNRYFRLAPSVAIMGILMSTELLTLLSPSPHLHYIMRVFKAVCENNILPTVLLINNYNYVGEMCNPVTWYISADFQYYVITAFIVYLILKFKWNVAKTVATGIFVTCFLYGSIIYVNRLDKIFEICIRNLELGHFFTSLPFKMSYSATHASMTAPFLGIMFGFLYVKHRDRTDLHKSKALVVLWYTLFYGLCALAMYLHTQTFSGNTNALLGPFLKPIFIFGIGVGIFGMSHNIGGITKRILEMRFPEVMGNFCFGAYIMHVLFCFTRGLTTFTLYDARRLTFDYVQDWILSFAAGTWFALAIEYQLSVLQKEILPQIKKKCKTANSSEYSVKNGTANGKYKLK